MKINALLPYNYQTYSQKTQPVNFRKTAIFKGSKEDNVVKIFKELVKIPSPPLKESNVAKWILSFCKKNKINAVFDGYKNIKLNIPATDITKEPLLFTAHMDVVGDDSPVNIVEENGYIKTDGKRTLGADNKAGVAAALELAKAISSSDIKHGGLEILFTRDEELGMTGIINADLKDIKSKYALVLDEAKLGRFDISGANFVTGILSISTKYGGHSGLDIGDEYRLNAAKIIYELISEIPQGVYYKDKNNIITSINIGTVISGDIQNSAAKILEDRVISDNYLDFFMKNAVTNVINTRAMAALSYRSSSKEKEIELRQLLNDIVNRFNNKYKGLAEANIQFEELMPIFETNEDKTMENIYKDACNKVGIKPCISTFPAGAETHILANRKNKNNEKFLPYLLGIANISNMHSNQEKMNIDSLKKGYELIKNIFFKFNKN